MPHDPSLDELLAQALSVPEGDEREAWIHETCGGTPGLERELRELLRSVDSAGSFLASPMVDELPDVTAESVPATIGPFRVDGEIGRGGMGVVLGATDPRLGRRVAIKTLPAALVLSPEHVARLEREATALALLSHANIAGIHGIEEQDGRRYLVLEHVDGDALDTRLDGGPLPIDVAVAENEEK